MKPVLIINCAEPEVRNFVEPLAEIAENMSFPFGVHEYRDLPNLDMEGFSGLILSGSPCGDDIVDHHLPYFGFLAFWDKPLLGICAGHHLLGAYFGAELIRNKEKEIGEVLVAVNEKSVIFDGLPAVFKAQAMHHDSITAPIGFNVIASTSACHNAAMKKSDRDWFSFQFHPELKNTGIVENFLRIVTFAD